MRRRITIAAVVVAALVAGLLVISNQPPAPYTGPVAADRQQLSRFDPELIVSLSLTRRGGQRVLLERDHGAWQTREPFAFRFDWARLQQLRESFASLFAERIVLEDPTDRAQFGLDPPLVVATARLQDGSTYEFYLGDAAPGGEVHYLSSRDDRAVFTVKPVHATRFSWTVSDLRDVTLTVLEAPAINRIWWRGPTGEVELVTSAGQPRYRHLAGTRILLQPLVAAANGQVFAEIASQLAGLSVRERVSGDSSRHAELGLAPARAEVRARDIDTELHLLIGNSDGRDAFVREAGSEVVYRVGVGAIGFLALTVAELTSTAPLDLAIENIASLTIATANSGFRVELDHQFDGQRVAHTETTIGDALLAAADWQQLVGELTGLQADALASSEESAAFASTTAARTGPGATLTVTLELIGADLPTTTARFWPRTTAATGGVGTLGSLHYLDLGRPPLFLIDSRKVARLTELLESLAPATR
jgi:hypothetical protein